MEYVEAYLKTIKTGQYSTSTIMFVFQDAESSGNIPTVVPVEMTSFGEESLQKAAGLAVSQEPGRKLDLIMYARFEDNFKSKDNYRVTFGCRDGHGNTLHRMYSVSKARKIEVIDTLPFHNIWTPNVGKKIELKYERLNDPVLLSLATNYAMTKSDIPETVVDNL